MRFTDNKDGTVTDNQTGLMWLKDANFDVIKSAWERAVLFCENLDYAGHKDWRLPAVKELVSLVDYSRYNPALPDHPFINVQSSNYWSSSTFAYNTYNAWVVYMSNGYVHGNGKSYYNYVWPVRGCKEAE